MWGTAVCSRETSRRAGPWRIRTGAAAAHPPRLSPVDGVRKAARMKP